MRKAGTLVIAFVLLLAVAGCGGGNVSSGGDDSKTIGRTVEAAGLPAVAINTGDGDEVEVAVEVADDPVERSRGLMDRTALAEDRGMLFVYPREETLSFWMKNTLIPLSIAFIDTDGRIVSLQDMEPLDTTGHASPEPVLYALEVNRGFFEERGVEVGDTVELPPDV